LTLSVILCANGNVMTLSALLSAILFVNVLNVKCNARRLIAPNARFTVRDLNAVFVAPRICAKKKIARNVKLFVLLPNVTLNALPLSLSAHLSVKKLAATGNARNPRCAPSPSASFNARNLLVKIKELLLNPHKDLAVNVQTRTFLML